MILVLASRNDDDSRALARRWQSHDARLLVPEMLSVVGWRHRSGSASSSQAMAGGSPVSLANIRGVLVRLPCVMPAELPQIQPEDRAYAAAEMTAFLTAWLSSLPCPVLNRPTATSLAGPAFRQEQWVHAAARAGVPVAAVHRTTRGYAPPPHLSAPMMAVVVVGDQCFGATTEALAERARKVARHTQVSLLDAYFTGSPDDPVFVGADIWVNLRDPRITDAALELLGGRGAQPEESFT